MKEMEDLIARWISMVLSLRSVDRAMSLFVVIVSMLWVLSGIQSTLHARIARSHSAEDRSLNLEESLIVRLTTINKLVHFAQVAENQLLDDVLMLSTRNGIPNILYALSV